MFGSKGALTNEEADSHQYRRHTAWHMARWPAWRRLGGVGQVAVLASTGEADQDSLED